MTQPQTPTERTAYLRQRAAHHGMSMEECAQYLAALRKDYREIGRTSSRAHIGFGFGAIPIPEGTYTPPPVQPCRCPVSATAEPHDCPYSVATDPGATRVPCRCCDACTKLCAGDVES